MKNYFKILSLCQLLSLELSAQNNPQWITEILDLEIDGEQNMEAYEQMILRYRTPLDINNASYKELAGLYILSEKQIVQLMRHIQKYGPLVSIYELQTIPGFSTQTIKALQPYIIIDTDRHHSQLSKSLKGYVLTRADRIIEQKSGYQHADPDIRYMGSPVKIVSKLRLSVGPRIQTGITVEKDAGESLMWSPSEGAYGFDHVSGFVRLKGDKFVKNIIIVDFTNLWVQGLVMGGGFFMGKGREPIMTVKRNSIGFEPYGSVSEYGYFRGAAIEVTPGPLTVSSFFSSRNVDAGMNTEGEITSLLTSGLHRNLRELSKRQVVKEHAAGINIEYQPHNKHLSFGTSLIYNRYSVPFETTEKPYKLFDNTDADNMVAGMHFEYRKTNAVFFGEAAAAQTGGYGLISGLIASLSHSFDVIIVVRDYSRKFNSPYAFQAFRVSSQARNEKGIYWGVKYRPNTTLLLSAFADVYTYPWLTPAVYSPSYGNDFMFNIEYNPSDIIQVRGLLRSGKKEKNNRTKDTKIPGVNSGQKLQLHTDTRITLSSHVAVRFSIRHSSYKIGEAISKGFLFYQDFILTYPKTTLSTRFAIIDSPEFQNRFYVYERDLLYSFSVPMYYGTGTKYYILLKQVLFPKLHLWLKWSRATFSNRTYIGSGTEKISGNIKSEIKGQLIYKF